MQTTGFRELPRPDESQPAPKGRVVVVRRRTQRVSSRPRRRFERLRTRPGLLAPRALPRADNALLGMEQRRHRRRWAVIAIAVVATADVVGALVPRTRHHLAILERNFPLGLSESGRALLLVAGLLLLL